MVRPTSRSSNSPALRSIPGLIVLRPADANEVAEAWRVALGLRHEPACPDLEPAAPARLSTARATRRRPECNAAPMFSPMPGTVNRTSS